MKTTPILAGICCWIITIGCSHNETAEDHRIVDIPDSILIHFSYSLIPAGYDGYHSATSFYDPSRHITQHAGTFTSPGSKEALVAVPYVSSNGSFSKLFIVKIQGTENELINWFHSDCTSFTVADINHDGMEEIMAENNYTDRENISHKIYEVFSLAGDTVKVMYQRYSVDARKADDLQDRIEGDTILKWYEHILQDPDHDSIFEIKEILKLSTIDEIQPGKVSLSDTNDTLLVSLEKVH